jgi:hypothetical protein
MKRHLIVGGLLMLACSTAHAGLIGSQVTGNLQFDGNPNNYFDPANGFVPAGFLNTAGTTVTIAEPQIEFGYRDGANQDTANFTDSQLVISDQAFGNFFDNPVHMTFTDSSFAGLTLVSSNFPGGISFSLSGNTITFDWGGGPVSAGTYTAVFNVATPVPEPSTFALFGTVIGLGLGGLVWRRRQLAPSVA